MTKLIVHKDASPQGPLPGAGDVSTDAGQRDWEQVRAQRQRVAATVKDAFGRTISVAHVSAFDRMRLAGMITLEEAASKDFMPYAVLAMSTRQVGDNPPLGDWTRVELDQRCEQLDDEGFAAVMEAWAELGWFRRAGETKDEAGAAESQERDHLKNSPSTPTSSARPS